MTLHVPRTLLYSSHPASEFLFLAGWSFIRPLTCRNASNRLSTKQHLVTINVINTNLFWILASFQYWFTHFFAGCLRPDSDCWSTSSRTSDVMLLTLLLVCIPGPCRTTRSEYYIQGNDMYLITNFEFVCGRQIINFSHLKLSETVNFSDFLFDMMFYFT